jgi:hypothetical protein
VLSGRRLARNGGAVEERCKNAARLVSLKQAQKLETSALELERRATLPPRLAWRAPSQGQLSDRTERIGVGVESYDTPDMNVYAALEPDACQT